MTDQLSTLRRQLQQLQDLGEAGVLGEQSCREARAALERKLVDLVLAGAAPAAVPTGRPSARLLGASAFAVLVLAAAGYAWTGSPQLAGAPAPGAWAQGGETEATPAAPPHALGADQIGAMVDGLAERLRRNPDDAQGWAMLARSYRVLGRDAEALAADREAAKVVAK